MPGPDIAAHRSQSVELNVVLSGHKRTEKQVRKALEDAGFTLVETRPDNWGLPSYTDPITAEMAGKPNSGHTPGTPHPDALIHLVLDGDHDAGCTRLSPLEWMLEHPEWVPKIHKVKVGKDDRRRDIIQEHVESIEEDDHRLHIDCEHVGTTEWRGRDSKHVGSPYEHDERIGFVGATVQCERSPEAQSTAASRAEETVTDIGWQLRLHWETQPTPAKKTLAETLEAAGINPDELRDFLKEG